MFKEPKIIHKNEKCCKCNGKKMYYIFVYKDISIKVKQKNSL